MCSWILSKRGRISIQVEKIVNSQLTHLTAVRKVSLNAQLRTGMHAGHFCKDDQWAITASSFNKQHSPNPMEGHISFGMSDFQNMQHAASRYLVPCGQPFDASGCVTLICFSRSHASVMFTITDAFVITVSAYLWIIITILVSFTNTNIILFYKNKLIHLRIQHVMNGFNPHVHQMNNSDI